MLKLAWVAVVLALAQPALAQEQILAAGDIASTGPGKEQTAELLDAHPSGIVVTLGDNAYPNGTLAEFQTLYDPTWGRHVARTFPAPGNHDYNVTNGAGYDAYFRSRGRPVGVLGNHWYSYNVGAWHVVSLNTSRDLAVDSEQLAWLQADLAANPRTCVAVIGHYPRFSSEHSIPELSALWQTLYDHGVELYLSGHTHNYERFAPQDAEGNADGRGPVQWVVGTGGASASGAGSPEPNSAKLAGGVFGVLELTLQPTSYSWRFLQAAGPSFTDQGSAYCVGAVPVPGCGFGPEIMIPLAALLAVRLRRST